MAKSYDRKAALFKVETTEGVDAAPTGSANAIRTINYQPTFMDAQQRTRPIDKAWMGANPVAHYAFKRGASFGVEMAGAGTATGVPAWMILNQMCGFAAGTVGGSSVVQNGSTGAIASMTHWAAFLDEVNSAQSFLLKCLGGKSSLGFRIADDDIPAFSYGYMGRPPATLAEEGAMLQPTLAGQAEPVIASTENTTFSLDGFALPLRSIELGSNADLELRSLIGPTDFIAYRDDNWNGTIVAEVPALASKDYFAKIRPSTTMVMQIIHGTIAGNIVQIDAPKIQISGNVSFSEEQGKMMMTMPVTALPNAGNDELVFTSK